MIFRRSSSLQRPRTPKTISTERELQGGHKPVHSTLGTPAFSTLNPLPPRYAQRSIGRLSAARITWAGIVFRYCSVRYATHFNEPIAASISANRTERSQCILPTKPRSNRTVDRRSTWNKESVWTGAAPFNFTGANDSGNLRGSDWLLRLCGRKREGRKCQLTPSPF
jgi:hypothetical protein